MRETWLEENQRLVAIDNFGNDLPAVEAATKKHEAIETDIMVSMWLFVPCIAKQSLTIVKSLQRKIKCRPKIV